MALISYCVQPGEKGSWLAKSTLKTSLTEVISSGPTPSPGTMVTLKVPSARASGVSAPQRLAETLSGRVASWCRRTPPKPWEMSTSSKLKQKNHKLFSFSFIRVSNFRTLSKNKQTLGSSKVKQSVFKADPYSKNLSVFYFRNMKFLHDRHCCETADNTDNKLRMITE